MKKSVAVFGLGLILFCLISCSEDTQTVKWYKEHPQMLKTEFEKCKLKTPAELAVDKHCTVIQQAQAEAFHEQQRNAPIPTFK